MTKKTEFAMHAYIALSGLYLFAVVYPASSSPVKVENPLKGITLHDSSVSRLSCGIPGVPEYKGIIHEVEWAGKSIRVMPTVPSHFYHDSGYRHTHIVMHKKEPARPTQQGDLALLKEPVAQELLKSTIPARLAYIFHDGTPRVVPIWFHWTGDVFVLGSPLTAPKVKTLQSKPKVALTIDGNTFPYKVLQIRGTAQVETMEGVVPEYAIAAERYFGAEQGKAWIEQVRGMFPQMARIVIQPEWVGILDFEQRFPSAIEAPMSGE